MKRCIFSLLLFTFFTSCTKDIEPRSIPVSVVNEKMEDINFNELHSIFQFGVEPKKDTLRFEVLTGLIRKNDTIKSIHSYRKKNDLYIEISSSPNDFSCLADSCWAAHKILFDLLDLDTGKYSVHFNINNGIQEKAKIEYTF